MCYGYNDEIFQVKAKYMKINEIQNTAFKGYDNLIGQKGYSSKLGIYSAFLTARLNNNNTRDLYAWNLFQKSMNIAEPKDIIMFSHILDKNKGERFSVNGYDIYNGAELLEIDRSPEKIKKNAVKNTLNLYTFLASLTKRIASEPNTFRDRYISNVALFSSDTLAEILPNLRNIDKNIYIKLVDSAISRKDLDTVGKFLNKQIADTMNVFFK